MIYLFSVCNKHSGLLFHEHFFMFGHNVYRYDITTDYTGNREIGSTKYIINFTQDEITWCNWEYADDLYFQLPNKWRYIDYEITDIYLKLRECVYEISLTLLKEI